MDNAISAGRVFTPRLPALNVAEAAYRGWHEASRLLDLLSPTPATATSRSRRSHGIGDASALAAATMTLQ